MLIKEIAREQQYGNEYEQQPKVERGAIQLYWLAIRIFFSHDKTST
jgi:hypothetical protein